MQSGVVKKNKKRLNGFFMLPAGGDIQVHLNKLECRGKVHYFSNSTQIVKLVY